MPKDPSACCDVCNLDLVHVMIDDRDDNNQAVPRGSNPSKRPLHTLTLRASQFRDALYDWRTETATGLFGALDFWPADLLLHEEILEDIVVLVDANKILTVQDLREETGWILCDQYGDQIISLIQRFFPPTPLSNLFVSTPLSTNTQEGPYPSLECSEHAMRELTRTLDLYCVLSEGSQKYVCPSALSSPPPPLQPSTDAMQQKTR